MSIETGNQGGESLEEARERIFAEIHADMAANPNDELNPVLLEALEDDAVLQGFLLGEERRKQQE